jgi:hypothetical protein
VTRNRPKVSALREAFGLFLSIALVLAALVACGDPAWGVSGTLVDAKGTPIAGATVAFLCSSTGSSHTMVSKAGGEFETGGVASDPGKACSLEIVAGGHATKIVPITAACYRSTSARNYGDPCKPGEGRIVVP